MEAGHYPGLAIAVASGKRSLWHKGYGYADLQLDIPVDAGDHLFRIGSISKTITAAALGRLSQRGEIDLDQPIEKYYKECPPDKGLITLRQLGGHLAGIRHYRGIEFLSNIPYRNVIDPLEVFIHDTLLSDPGRLFNYSTYGWTLISAVMEKASKEPFTSLIRREVNIPLGLMDLKPDYKDSTHFHRVSFYEWRDSMHLPSPEVDNSNKWAGGGFLCSAEEVAKFGHAHLSPGYLSKAKLEEFTQSQVDGEGKETGYGIGYNDRNDKEGRSWIGHSGGSVGGTSMLLIYPEEKLVVVTLVNLSGAQMDDLAFRIADIILSERK
jgi:serine beta-lactamase-like protein LACTB, mitochondrial